MKKQIIIATIISSIVAMAQTNISVGGDNSFNSNSGTITISQSDLIKNEQIAIDEVLGKEMKKATLLMSLVTKAKKINNIKTTKQDKKRRCKDEASGMFAVFGHEVNFGYKKCDEWF